MKTLVNVRKDSVNVDKYPNLKKTYYFGKIRYGSPYFYPRNFSSTIIRIRKIYKNSEEYLAKLANDWIRKQDNHIYKNIPLVRRSKSWTVKVFNSYYWIEIGWPFAIRNYPLGWKDKHDTPRFEWSPAFMIFFFKWQFCIHWNAPDGNNDRYWEQWLWIFRYHKGDYKLAKEKWPWQEYPSKKSSWIDYPEYPLKHI